MCYTIEYNNFLHNYNKAVHLATSHYKEVFGEGADECVPSLSSYLYFEEQGSLKSLWLYKEEEVVGYCFFFISSDYHRNMKDVVRIDALYLHPDHRKGFIGLKLLKEVEDICKEAGITEISCGARLDSSLYKILERRGYHPSTVNMVRS